MKKAISLRIWPIQLDFLGRILFRSVLFSPISSRTCWLVTFSEHFTFSILLLHHIWKLVIRISLTYLVILSKRGTTAGNNWICVVTQNVITKCREQPLIAFLAPLTRYTTFYLAFFHCNFYANLICSSLFLFRAAQNTAHLRIRKEAIHKLRHTLRGRGSTKCDIVWQGGDPNFVTSHFKNSIKAILHV